MHIFPSENVIGVKLLFSVTEIKFHLRFERHHGSGCVWFCGHFQPDKTEQLSLSLSKKLAKHQLKSHQPEEKGEKTIKTAKSLHRQNNFTCVAAGSSTLADPG